MGSFNVLASLTAPDSASLGGTLSLTRSAGAPGVALAGQNTFAHCPSIRCSRTTAIASGWTSSTCSKRLAMGSPFERLLNNLVDEGIVFYSRAGASDRFARQ